MSITATESTLANADRTDMTKSLLGVIPSDIPVEESTERKDLQNMKVLIDTCVEE